MPRSDDPNFKIKEVKQPFKRRGNLTAWDVSVDDLRPTAISKEAIQSFDATENMEQTSSDFNESIAVKPLPNIPVKATEYENQPKQENLINKVPDINKNIDNSVKRLYGLQKKLLHFIVENCASRNMLQTSLLSKDELKKALNTDTDNVKTTIHRLQTSGLITRENGKRGPGGFRIFNITEEVRNAVLAEIDSYQ